MSLNLKAGKGQNTSGESLTIREVTYETISKELLRSYLKTEGMDY